MGMVEEKLRSMGLELPEPLVLAGENRTAVVQVGEILFLSGHPAGLLEDPNIKKRGKVGLEVSEQEGYEAARACALKMLATVKSVVGDLDRVVRVVKVLGMVNSHPDFERHNKVINGASDLLYEVFGPEVGRHARSSVGVDGLVDREPVEIEAIFQIAPEP